MCRRTIYLVLSAIALALPPAAIAANPYDAWAAGYFGTALEPTAAYDRDLDQGGDSNLVEFALGTNPLDTSSRAETGIGRETVGQERVFIRYRRRTGDALNYFRYQPEISADQTARESVGG